MSAERGAIASLQICPAHREPMRRVETAQAIADKGLEGDVHGERGGGSRQVLLMDEETLAAFGLAAGIVKENVTTRGVALKELAPGTRLRIGTALFEITQSCTPCRRMDDIRPGLREALQGQRGMLARVLESGTLRIGDAIEIVAG